MSPRRNANPELEEFETYDLAAELAGRMDMTRQEAEKFINKVMHEAGYAPVQTRDSWQRDDQRDAEGGKRRGRFGGGRDDNGGFSD